MTKCVVRFSVGICKWICDTHDEPGGCDEHGCLQGAREHIAHLEERAEFWEDEYTGARIKIAELEAQCAGLELMLAEGAEFEGECEECRKYRKLEAAGLALYWKIRHNPDVCGLDEFEDWRNTLAGES